MIYLLSETVKPRKEFGLSTTVVLSTHSSASAAWEEAYRVDPDGHRDLLVVKYDPETGRSSND